MEIRHSNYFDKDFYVPCAVGHRRIMKDDFGGYVMHNPSRQGNCRLFLATCALVAPLFLASVPARAQQPAETQPPAASEKLVNVDVREARLEQTITGLMSLNGLTNIVVRNEAGKNFGLVTVKLADQPLSVVLKAIASSAGAMLEEQDGIYYLRHKNEKDDAPKPQVAPRPNPADAVAVAAPKPRKPRQLARVPLNYLQSSGKLLCEDAG
jgi:hypothetical protein